MTKSDVPLGERISWPLTFVYYYVGPTTFLAFLVSLLLWYSWYSAYHHKWIEAAAGVIAAALACATSRDVGGGLHDLWLSGDTLIFTRWRSRIDVPIDRVTTVHIPVRASFTRIVAIYWKDDAGVERRVKVPVRESSPGWRALFQRLVNRIRPVHVATD